MRVQFVYPSFSRHAADHPELTAYVPCEEYLGPPSLGMACVAGATPGDVEVGLVDDRVERFDPERHVADLYALSVFTPNATRAFEISADLRARGRKVVMGGIFPTLVPEVAREHADAIVVGEGEPVWRRLLDDFESGSLKPSYSAEPGSLEHLAPPRIELYLDVEKPHLRPDDYPVQLSRGCPLTCDACVLPGSMGKKLRLVPMPTVMHTVRALARAGKLLSLTEDTSFFGFSGARAHFRAFLEEVPRVEGARISYVGISMPVVHKLDKTLFAAARDAGIRMFYLVCGFDEITRRAFGSGDPEAMRRAEACIARCHDEGIEPYTSLMVGNDGDDPGVVDRILEFCERTRLEKSEFTIFTPYPGTPAWHRLLAEGRILDRNWAHYNDANVVFRPKQMTPDELLDGYLRLWRDFYRSRRHLEGKVHEDRTIQF
ncbi:MAG: cobalamin B12-binding domain-containing protein [Deltaproteobacteria bacterium]|nr:cobalamin B12-binding domain-containing protein [Deltaproteobacteria bacterium]